MSRESRDIESLKKELADVKGQLSTILDLKTEFEQRRADRVILFRNSILQLFAANSASVEEMQLVLDLVRFEMVQKYNTYLETIAKESTVPAR